MDLSEMLDMQKELARLHKEDWGEKTPEGAPFSLLWGIGEMGEVIDVIKKFGKDAVMGDPVIRQHLIEEMGDVFMYLLDIFLCYSISAEEFTAVYKAKHAHNMGRDFDAEHEKWRAEEEKRQKEEYTDIDFRR